MATQPQGPPQSPPQAAPSQGGVPAGGASATGQVLQLIAVITRASDALSKVFPPSAPMVSAIQNQLQQVQSKVAETQRPTQPQAPPI